MSKDNGQTDPATLLEEVRATAEELLLRACSPGIQESGLFPYGINRLSIQVRAGEAEVSLEISGPEQAQQSDEDWDDDDDFFDDEDEDEEEEEE